MKFTYKRILASLGATAVLLGVPGLVLAQQLIGFETAWSNSYHVSSDSSGVVSYTATNGDLQVTLDPGQFIRLSSSSRKEVSLSSSDGLAVSATCSDSEYVVRIDVASTGSQRTFTITPTSTTCTTSGSSSGSTSTGGGGGGGGGGPIRLPSTPAPTTPPATTPPAEPAPASVPAVPAVSPAFVSDLSVGASGGDVTRLQQLLASDPSVYPEGLVTGYFGNLTVKAVRAFQAKYGLSQVGRVGPATRAKLAEIFGSGQTPSAVPTPASPKAFGLTRELNPGSSGEDVRALQEFLAKDSSVYPEGLVTGYYGALTVKAVRAFQAKYGISQVGRVGPQTLGKLQELMAGGVAPVAPAPVPEPAPTPAAPAPAPVSSGLTPDPETSKPFSPRTYGQ